MRLVMMIAGGYVEFADIDQAGELVKVKHRFVLTVFAKERDVLTEVHILEMVGDKAPVTPLDALAKFGDRGRIVLGRHFTTPRLELSIKSVRRSTSLQPVISVLMRSMACVVFSFDESNRWNA